MNTQLPTAGGYDSYYKEIERRVEASKQGESKFFEKIESGGTDLPYDLPDQKHVVFSLSTQEIPPRAIDTLQPALRILGCFPTRIDAQEYAESVAETNKNVSLFIDDCREWIVSANTWDNLKNAEHLKSVKETLLSEYRDARTRNEREFEDARAGKDVERTMEKRSEQPDNVPLTTSDSRSHVLRGGNSVPSQDMAVVLILPNRKTGEFCFQVLGCFAKKEDAERWIVNVASRKIVIFDIHVVATCQWIFPNRMDGDGAQDQKYRTPELQKIMDHKQGAPAEIKQFEDWMSENQISETSQDETSSLERIDE